MQTPFDADYWTSRYKNNLTAWDAGSVTLPVKQYLDQLEDKSIAILIPGAGNGHEAAYAFHNGFTNVHILDVSPFPLENFIKKYPNFPRTQIHLEDFFVHENKYDLVIEQTFFCSLIPSQRKNYIKKMKKIINPGGKLVGVLFNSHFEKEGPPFGGVKEEYETLFNDYFKIKVLDTCINSISPRKGRELFFILVNS